ncbi:MAG: 2-amino-4-hydroxy-6-hydroxymethyldihydropteridine diphosphokinase [Acidobacteriota bacterium]
MYLGLGSNMGDREAHLRSALRQLEAPNLRLQRVSGLYETEPVGLRNQAWFLNLVAEFETELMPKQLLHRAQRVERELGRQRTIPNGPRTVDVDVLLYGNAVIRCDELVVPHPRYHERRFVLAPLAELNPALRDPVTGRSVAELLQAVRGQVVKEAGRLHS